MAERYITPSKITAWLDCPHYLTLKHQVEDAVLSVPSTGMGSFAQLLMDKGLQHERQCLADLTAQGLVVHEVPERQQRESFAAWAARVGDPFSVDADVLYQVPMLHEGIRGIADFLLRVVDEDGSVTWEPLDAKLARKEAKPGHVLQLCFYAEAIAAATGQRPRRMHLWLGSGLREELLVEDFAAYWRRLRTQLETLLGGGGPGEETRPEPCDHCAFCEFAPVCERQWRDEDSLIYVAGLRRTDRDLLTAVGLTTLTELAESSAPLEGRLARGRTQAQLQLALRPDDGVATPPSQAIAPQEGEPVWGRGFETMPAADDGDVFLDFEGHPFWRADRGLFFLLGLIERDADGQWVYRTWRADNPQQEGEAAGLLIEYLANRRADHPHMHVYHYNHTERSSLVAMATEHGVGEVALGQLIETGAFVDLYRVALNAIQVGTESYGLKALERLTDYERGHDIDKGAGAVLEYERYMASGDESAIDAIKAYNEDDVRATRALRDWLLRARPADLAWREAVLTPAEEMFVVDEQVEALHAFGPGTVEHDLGDVLGYWSREWKAHLAPLLVRCEADEADLVEDPEAVAGLQTLGLHPRVTAGGKAAKHPGLRLSFPEQDITRLQAGDQVVFLTPDGEVGYAELGRLDDGELELVWNERNQELGWHPSVIVRNGWFRTTPKPQTLSQLAADVLDPGATANPLAMAILGRALPGCVPANGFTDDLTDMRRWVRELNHDCVAVQGPPGTGKTYSGARLIRELIHQGKRVGISATSHEAIDNLLRGVVEVFAEHGDAAALRAVKRGPRDPGLPGVAHAAGNSAAANAQYNLVAGTSWLFAGRDMQSTPVDVLVIDEAGQMGLADALVSCSSARSVILLGDPQQLPQVAQATHPGISGLSVLQHVIGPRATVEPERGVFLGQTWRMHPDICSFISDEMYDGRLTHHESTAAQSTSYGTGLRWIPALHAERVTESIEEAEIVAAEIRRLLGTSWTDQSGRTRPLTVADVLLVAPYNDQVNLLRTHLDASPATAGVAVGTVDKFQGQEAAVVFFTMTTSSALDMPRGADFLFSSNRFNVAISRARCLAYLVCTQELLDTRGRTVDEIRLISRLCTFAERAEVVAPSV